MSLQRVQTMKSTDRPASEGGLDVIGGHFAQKVKPVFRELWVAATH